MVASVRSRLLAVANCGVIEKNRTRRLFQSPRFSLETSLGSYAAGDIEHEPADHHLL